MKRCYWSKVFLLTGSLLHLISSWCYGQTIYNTENTSDNKQANALTTAVPFLLITPDSRSGGMGETGAALSPDVTAMHGNPARYAFVTNPGAVSLAYTPWLRAIGITDVNMAYVSGYRKLNERQTLGASLRYFSCGTIDFTDNTGHVIQQYQPAELAIDIAYARKLSHKLSMAMAMRYIRSDLGIGFLGYNNAIRASQALAVDIALFHSSTVQLLGAESIIAYGIHVANIGPKIQYGNQKLFLPMNLKTGTAITFPIDATNKLTFALDLNKLLVPTLSTNTTSGNASTDISVPDAIFSSFSDAPGGFKEELQEITYATGLEYNYNNLFALRTGYFYEHPNKGNRQYITFGAGLKYSAFGVDIAYLTSTQKHNPIENTLRFTLQYIFGNSLQKKL